MTAQPTPALPAPPVVFSFDVEEHHRIEAAHHLSVGDDLKADYARRMEHHTREILGWLAEARAAATFYVVGEIARTHPKLVRDIADAGHEVGSHGHDHRRVDRFTPETFRADLLASKSALEDISGAAVVGYRAPTFSVTRSTAWAIDVLAECGFRYDSSVFPVRHDRYGVPAAPRGPFLAGGPTSQVVELPPATWRVRGQNLPVAGGGYFRLFPPAVMRAGIAQLARAGLPAVLYFHPWEFDPTQPRLPLGRLSAWRTYVGVGPAPRRLRALLGVYGARAVRADRLAAGLDPAGLARFDLTPTAAGPSAPGGSRPAPPNRVPR